MKQLSFEAVQVAALYELYLSTVADGIMSIAADDLAARIGHGCTRSYLVVALAELDDQGLISLNVNAASRASSIKPSGIRHVEKGLNDPKSAFSRMRDSREGYIEDRAIVVRAIPAANRVVAIDHNSSPVREIVKNTEDLKQKIRLGNDLGDLTPEEATAAISEVSQIEQAMNSDWVRPEQVIALARKTLKWLGEKAAGAAVGKAALALMALIATFFGFPI